MPGDRLARILAELSAEADGAWASSRLCDVTREIVDMSGAGVMLMSGVLSVGSLCTTDDVSNLIEELQFTLGEGPCVDAHDLGRVVLEPHLSCGSSFQCEAHKSIAASSAATESKLTSRNARLVSCANQPSIRFSHELTWA